MNLTQRLKYVEGWINQTLNIDLQVAICFILRNFSGSEKVWKCSCNKFLPSSSTSSSSNPLARISLTLSRHFSLSFIASGRSSGLHPVSSHSCCMYVQAGRPAFGRPYVGVHRSTSLMSSSLLLQQCPACLVRLPWIVFLVGGRWPYSWCLVGCCSLTTFAIKERYIVPSKPVIRAWFIQPYTYFYHIYIYK